MTWRYKGEKAAENNNPAHPVTNVGKYKYMQNDSNSGGRNIKEKKHECIKYWLKYRFVETN